MSRVVAPHPFNSPLTQGYDSQTTMRKSLFLQEFLKVARLQSEFCTKDFFRATNFLTKNAPKISPKFLSLCSVGQKKSPENSLQISHKIFQISLRKIQKNSPTSFCRSAGRRVSGRVRPRQGVLLAVLVKIPVFGR